MILNKRKCIVSKESKPREELIRICKTKDNKFHVNSEEKGRGAYVSKDASIEVVLRNKLLHRTFKRDVPKEVYNELSKHLKGGSDVKK
ncbi:MAG: YlxR family protein [Mycoplasmataceae bacterium]|nr:YlxR family protein [Mycoplasmataceae bacterium]